MSGHLHPDELTPEDRLRLLPSSHPNPHNLPTIGLCGHVACVDWRGKPAGTVACVVESHVGEQIKVRTVDDCAYVVPPSKFAHDAKLV
ncbi:MAG TPA: hypothetical protein VFF65_03310, partial [Phycisphaerales bacterium]|nr:hypothetical protein [Phycisphaerales bacterium]